MPVKKNPVYSEFLRTNILQKVITHIALEIYVVKCIRLANTISYIGTIILENLTCVSMDRN